MEGLPHLLRSEIGSTVERIEVMHPVELLIPFMVCAFLFLMLLEFGE